MSYRDVAQICLNGHRINDYFVDSPEHNKDFCDKCGAKTITLCEHCHRNIDGGTIAEDALEYTVPLMNSPAYCPNCGKPYPWTQRKLQAAEELINELDEISEDEKKKAIDSLPDLMAETPRTELAVSRIKRLYDKVPLSLKETFRKLVVDISAEAIKKSMTGM